MRYTVILGWCWVVPSDSVQAKDGGQEQQAKHDCGGAATKVHHICRRVNVMLLREVVVMMLGRRVLMFCAMLYVVCGS